MLYRPIVLSCAALALFCGDASSALAQDGEVLILTPPEACEVTQDIDPETRAFAAMHDGGAMLISTSGIEAVEYSCEFETAIVFDWSETTTQIRAGYCAEPGEFIYPQVFVVGMAESDPDVVLVWSSTESSGEPTRFAACRQGQ
jgi:hypothetical protein